MNESHFEKYRKFFPANLWQSTQWAHFQKELGNPVFFFDGDECLAMGIVKKLPFHQSYLELPRGPLGLTDGEFWKGVEKIATENNCAFCRISPMHNVQEVPRWHIQSPVQHFPENTLILDLTLSEEELLKQMKPKGRYNIRIAQREKVKVMESNDIKAFYSLLEETTKRDGFSGHPQSYYEKMIESFEGKAKLYLATVKNDHDEDTVIAGGIFTFLDETCTYYYGASSDTYRNLMAPYLVQWTAISEARNQKLKYYDFLGIAPENDAKHPLAGVTRFKEQFGGNRLKYPPAKDIIYKPFWYLAYWLYQFIKKNW